MNEMESFHTEQDTSDVNGEHHHSVSDHSFSATVTRLAGNFNGVELDEDVITEILDDMAENGELARHKVSSTETTAMQWMVRLMKILRYLKNKPSTTDFYAACYIWDLPELDMINSHLSMTEYAESIGVTRAAVNKAVREAQLYFKTPPRMEQRKESSRTKMKTRRIAQLK